MSNTIASSTGEKREGLRELEFTRVLTDNTTLTIADSGTVIAIATDAKTITLPTIDAGNLGMEFTFINTGANGAVKLNISPASSDAIIGTVANASADSTSGGVVNKDFTNTKATAKKGDYVVLKALTLAGWYIVGGVGVWASEA